MVLTQTGIPNPYIIDARTPDDWGGSTQGGGLGGGGWTYHLAGPFETFGGGFVASDDINFAPVGSGVAVGGISAIDYTGSEIGGFVIEGVSSVLESSSIVLLFLGLGALVLLRQRICS